MAMRGWRRIGIILSVIWFLGFGVFCSRAQTQRRMPMRIAS
jgi:hypothetical protein